MKRREPVLLSEVMKQFLNPADLDDNANRQRLMSYWRTVVGNYIARQTSRMWIKDRILHVVVNSAPLRNELMFVRSSLVARLNDATGISVIDDISFH